MSRCTQDILPLVRLDLPTILVLFDIAKIGMSPHCQSRLGPNLQLQTLFLMYSLKTIYFCHCLVLTRHGIKTCISDAEVLTRQPVPTRVLDRRCEAE